MSRSKATILQMSKHSPEDKSPLLTKKQRRLLWEHARGEREEEDRRERSRLRSRVRDVVTDFKFVFRYLPVDDQRAIFKDFDEFVEWRVEERERMVEHAQERGEGDELQGRIRSAGQSDAAQQGEELYQGVISALALIYRGLGSIGAFEGAIESAVTRAARDEGFLLDVDVTIDVEREVDREELLDQWKAGELTDEQILDALDLDPTLIFERELRDDE